MELAAAHQLVAGRSTLGRFSLNAIPEQTCALGVAVSLEGEILLYQVEDKMVMTNHL